MYMNDGNGIYERFNIQRPADFTGHSLSVSDVVVLNDGSTVKAYYVDSIGFAELPEFFKERNVYRYVFDRIYYFSNPSE